MTSQGENFQLPSTEVSWLKRDLLLFAVSIGASTDDLNFVFVSTRLYEKRRFHYPSQAYRADQEQNDIFQAFPTYSNILREFSS
jgi:hypothetical protein